jgi:rhodanese-related sulfurtransferase
MTDASPDCPRIGANELNDLLQGEEEIALLDAREELSFGQAHILYASCMPLSRLELLADAMVPRRSVRIVVCDGGEGLAERAASRLLLLGYEDVSVLDGGVDAWREAGLEIFSGVNVPSKAFGEFVEVEYETPSVSADELKQMMDDGEEMVILDSRPMVEYQARNIPNGICVPGAELAYRVHDIAPSSDTLVVVNCAGRTRSIIGAQSLINAGIGNRVVALRNGTMGWHLAGHSLEHGMNREARDVSEQGLAAAREAAARVAERFQVRRIDHATLAEWRAEAGERSLYVLDVRHPDEYEAGHLPGSRSAPGGQLVQETDHFVATLRSRVVLVDDTGVRATMTASWLNQMGWPEVVVLDDALEGVTLERGPEPVQVPGLDGLSVDAVSAAELEALLREQQASVIDLGLSRQYRAGHIPGAWFVTRARMGQCLQAVPKRGRLVLTSPDGALARLAAAEAATLGDESVQVLAGGTEAWIAAGLPLTSGAEHMADVADDVWLRPYEKDWGVEESMREYLTWEVGLVEQLERDGTARFQPRR